MGIRFFRGQKTKYSHEHHQIKEIARIVAGEFADQDVFILTNVLVSNGELDCVILTSHGPLILDLKAFSGTVRGSENGSWEVETKDGIHPLPNIFIQAKIHRQDFIDKMIPICRAHFPHIGESNLKKIGSWAYFCPGSSYADGQIDLRRVKWFRVVTAESLPEKLRFIDAGYTLRALDMEAIVRELRLSEYSFETNREIKQKKSGREGILGTPWRKGILVAVVIIALILVVPGSQVFISDSINSMMSTGGALVSSFSRETLKSGSSSSDSSDAIAYLNGIREQYGVSPLFFDERLFNLALVRAEDMAQYQYLSYINPKTGTCANSIKILYGLSPDENVVENAYGQWNGYTHGIERRAFDSWMAEPGNRAQVLGNYSSGAIACSGGYCSFLGLNHERTGTVCQKGPPGVNITH
ncbi:MAG TPA: NERD domain-containing protein [Methanoregulaceae archaeon]|nr:NERD domain-containing protein [Methanoregulaceae archaeon]